MQQSEIIKKYDTYKDSGIKWIGEIPQEWTVGNLKRLTDFIKNGTSVTQVENETEYKVSRIETISTGEINYSKTGYVKYFDNIYDYKLNDNDILFSNINSLEMVGNVAIYDNKQPLYSGMNLLRISVNKKTCPKWLFYVLRNSYFVEQVKANAKHAINQVSISVGRLSQIPIIIPTKDEQKKIADYLDKKCEAIDEIIETEKSVIEKLKEYKQSIITEAVTKGLDKSVPLKDSGIEWIGKIPEDWDIAPIGHLYSERKQKVSDTVYKPLSVTKQGIVPQLDSAAKSDAHDDRKLVCIGDFAINSRSDRRGSCGISDYEGSISLINTVLKPKTEMTPKYFNWLFHTTLFADEFYKWGHGIVDDLWTTNWSDMKKIMIALPAMSEQQQIAEYLDKKCSEIDKAIADKEQVIEKFTEYKKSLIYECVTGKRKVVE